MYSMYKNILILFIFIGIIFVVVALVNQSNECPTQKVVYRYIPRSFEEEQEEPVYATDIFRTMFTQPDPWVSSINEYDYKQKDKLNKFFISQI